MIKRSMAKEYGTEAVDQLPALKLGRDSYGSKALCQFFFFTSVLLCLLKSHLIIFNKTYCIHNYI